MAPMASEQTAYWKQKFLESKWWWAVFLVILTVSDFSGLFLPRLFGAPSAYPGSDPPWHFIREDFFEGLGNLAGMIAMLVVLAARWRRCPFTNWMVLTMVAVWMIPDIVTSILIYWRCRDFFDYSHAVSAWPTFAAYSKSGMQFVGIPIGIALALLCAAKARNCSVNRNQEQSPPEKV